MSTTKSKSKRGTPRAKNVVIKLPVLTLREAKRQVILKALNLSDGHAEAAAELLGIGKSTMYRLIVDLDINEKERY